MPNLIVALAGRKQSGKTTCAEFIQQVANATLKPLGSCSIYNFADSLKQDICMNILGLTKDQCYGTDDQKNELVNCYWNGKQLSAREVMQIVGTDIFRSMQKNVWSDATIRKIEKDKCSLAIVADCRFPNEVEAIKNAGGFVIKLTRNPHNSNHESEIALDEINFDHNQFDMVLDNTSISIEKQNIILLQFLKHKGILPL
jgi:hypothetical protein